MREKIVEKEFKTLWQWGASKGDVFESERGVKLTVDRTDKYTATGCSEYSDGFDLGEDTWSLDGIYWSLVSRGTHHPIRDHRIAYVSAIAAGADYDKAKQIADTIEGLGL